MCAERFFLSPTASCKLARGDAKTNEILLYSVGAAIAESEIVLGGAALIAMAFDGNLRRGVVLQEICGLLESFPRIRANGCGVVVKVGITNVLEEQFFQRRFASFGGKGGR